MKCNMARLTINLIPKCIDQIADTALYSVQWNLQGLSPETTMGSSVFRKLRPWFFLYRRSEARIHVGQDKPHVTMDISHVDDRLRLSAQEKPPG